MLVKLCSAVQKPCLTLHGCARMLSDKVDMAAKYRSDPQTLAKWLDVSVLNKQGRVFEARQLTAIESDSIVFPSLKAISLLDVETFVPECEHSDYKLVGFSFKHYGFTLVRSWLDPFSEKFKKDNRIAVVELCFVDYGFLSIAKNLFAKNLKSLLPDSSYANTHLVFGGIMEFAAKLLLPNKFTGYAYLLDRNNKVCWRGSGQALEEELVQLYQLTDDLLQQAPVSTTTKPDKNSNSHKSHKQRR